MATPLDQFAPYDSGAGADVTEATWRAMARHFRGDGVIRDEGGEFETIGDSTGMQVKVDTGECWIRGHWGESTAQKTLAIDAADPSLARIDLVVLRNDFVNNRIEVDVLTGTPAATPAAPSLTQNTSIWETQLAIVDVGAGVVTITAADVNPIRTYTDGSARYVVDSNHQFVGHNSFILIDFDTPHFETSAVTQVDSGGGPGINSFRLERSGFWQLTFNVHFADHSTGWREAHIIKNVDTANAIAAHRQTTVVGTSTMLNVSGMDRLTAGETVQFMVRQTSGTSIAITDANAATSCSLWWLGP